MMLNERLVPYQVAVALIGSVDEPSSEVIDYLYSLTKHLHISVYPFLNQIQSLEAQFDRWLELVLTTNKSENNWFWLI